MYWKKHKMFRILVWSYIHDMSGLPFWVGQHSSTWSIVFGNKKKPSKYVKIKPNIPELMYLSSFEYLLMLLHLLHKHLFYLNYLRMKSNLMFVCCPSQTLFIPILLRLFQLIVLLWQPCWKCLPCADPCLRLHTVVVQKQQQWRRGDRGEERTVKASCYTTGTLSLQGPGSHVHQLSQQRVRYCYVLLSVGLSVC